MPITSSGRKVLRKLRQEYGPQKAKRIFYAMIVMRKKGSQKWHGKSRTGKIPKAQRTYLETMRKAYAKVLK